MDSRIERTEKIVKDRKVTILDGGLATELENRGFALDNPLWSARFISDNPDAIKQVHTDYLKAGAEIITTASYQASFEGFEKLGCSKADTTALLKKSVEIAISSINEFFAKNNWCAKPKVAASIGPYGAFLANGAEYTGDYRITPEDLYEFHARRWEILVGTDSDLIACETIPSFGELEVLKKLIEQTPEKNVYVSFSCKDQKRINDGTPIRQCAEMLADRENVLAVGINCTKPQFVSGLIDQIKLGAPEKDIVVYPNSGEIYDAGSKDWLADSNVQSLADLAVDWFKSGARYIGGCCRTTPRQIAEIKRTLFECQKVVNE